jgi:predicted RNA binding protein YcfA (HicA-like mRNA interferase family)
LSLRLAVKPRNTERTSNEPCAKPSLQGPLDSTSIALCHRSQDGFGGYGVDSINSVGIVTTSTPHGGDVNSRFLISQLIADGWYLVRIRGSHHHFKHPIKPGLVTVPHPKKDLTKKTAMSILQQALL